MSVDKKAGTKLFAVSAFKALNRKQSYVLSLDFKKATVNFHKVKRGKEVKKIFPFTQCVKLEKDKKDNKMLSLTFGNYTDAAYKKTIFFDCNEDRGLLLLLLPPPLHAWTALVNIMCLIGGNVK